MQDDFADLCAFYPSMRDGETCLDMLSGWAEYSQVYPPPSLSASAAKKRKKGGGEGGGEKKEKDKRKRRDHGWMEEEGGEEDEEEVREAWRDDVFYWLCMEEIDFFTGKSKEGGRGGERAGRVEKVEESFVSPANDRTSHGTYSLPPSLPPSLSPFLSPS